MNKNKIICKKIKKSVGNIIFMTIYEYMKKKSYIPQTKVKNPEPKKKGTDWVIWAAWVIGLPGLLGSLGLFGLLGFLGYLGYLGFLGYLGYLAYLGYLGCLGYLD